MSWELVEDLESTPPESSGWETVKDTSSDVLNKAKNLKKSIGEKFYSHQERLANQQLKEDVIDDMDLTERMGVGFGRTVDKTIEGMAELGNEYIALPMAKMLPDSIGDPLEKEVLDLMEERKGVQAGYDKAFDPLFKEHPYSTTTGMALPYMADMAINPTKKALFAKSLVKNPAYKANVLPILHQMSKTPVASMPKALAPIGKYVDDVAKNVQGKMTPWLKRATPYTDDAVAFGERLHDVPVLGKMLTYGKEALKGGAQGGAIGATHYDADAVDSAVGGAVLRPAIRAALSPLSKQKSNLREGAQKTVDWGDDQGLKALPGMRKGDPVLQQTEGALMTHQGSIASLDRHVAANDRRLTEIVTKEVGDEVSELSDEFFTRNFNRLGSKIRKLGARSKPQISPKQMESVDKFHKDWVLRNGDDAFSKQISNLRSRVLEAKTQPKTGGWFRDTDDALTSALNGDTASRSGKEYIKHLRTTLRESVEDSLPSSMKGQWNKTNRDFALLYNVKDKYRTRAKGQQFNIIDPDKLDPGFKSIYPNIGKAADWSRLNNSQNTASLRASSQVGNMFHMTPSRGVGSLFTVGAKNLPEGALQNMALGAYKMGFPYNTGWLGLPTATPNVVPSIANIVSSVNAADPSTTIPNVKPRTLIPNRSAR